MPAGGQGQIDVKLMTGRRATKLKKSVYVYTNDKDNKMVILKVEATASLRKQ
ncbi:MAG: hypothetical protein JXN64_14000 [Spirochaetes bacterium]|nr:hypothetical protein [Spirochaetota bacterium]